MGAVGCWGWKGLRVPAWVPREPQPRNSGAIALPCPTEASAGQPFPSAGSPVEVRPARARGVPRSVTAQPHLTGAGGHLPNGRTVPGARLSVLAAALACVALWGTRLHRLGGSARRLRFPGDEEGVGRALVKVFWLQVTNQVQAARARRRTCCKNAGPCWGPRGRPAWRWGGGEQGRDCQAPRPASLLLLVHVHRSASARTCALASGSTRGRRGVVPQRPGSAARPKSVKDSDWLSLNVAANERGRGVGS